MRVLMSVLIVGGAIAFSGLASAQQAQTTRVETRPVYGGAVVTIEHGVRVYRPVPPTQHVIVNPEGRSPLAFIIDGVNGTLRR